mmetsp:Transcript_11880/g.28101  ORF Transcript_11880/g.28101 Transcript_11880/m.28101 type:complete len:223 (-) Transcript_11880:566-1234(-)
MQLHGAVGLVGAQGGVQLGVRGNDTLARLLAGGLVLLQLLLEAGELLRQLRLLCRELPPHVVLLGLHSCGPGVEAAVLRAAGGGQPAPDVPLRSEAHQRLPAIQAVVRMHKGRHRGLEVVLAHDLSGLLVAYLNLSILPARNDLRHTIVVQVKAIDAIDPILGLHTPSSGQLIVDPHRAVHQRIGEAALVQGFDAQNYVRLCDLLEDLFSFQSSDLEVLSAT